MNQYDDVTLTNKLKNINADIISRNNDGTISIVINYGNKTKLRNLKLGNAFKIGDYEFIVISQSYKYNTTSVILKDALYYGMFSDMYCKCTNNYKKSLIRYKLNNDFLNDISKYIGENNIIKRKVSLSFGNSKKSYGYCEDKVSLLTLNEYEHFKKFIPPINKYCYTSTPYLEYSNRHPDQELITAYSIRPDGTTAVQFLDFAISNYCRPFCVLSSFIDVLSIN